MSPKKVRKILVEEQVSANTESAACTVNETVSINSLNSDCLESIIKHLPIKDRIAVERVSKTWNSAIKSSWGSFKHLNFKKNLWGIENEFYTRSIGDRLKMLDSVLSRCGKFLTSLSMGSFGCTGKRGYENMNKLRDELLILNQVKKNCTNLKSLYLKNNVWIDKSSIPTLKTIIKNIQNFKCKFCDNVTDEDLKLLFSSCEKLKNLNITAGRGVTGDFLYFLKHEKIKDLRLSSFKSLAPLHYAIEKFEQLESLCVIDLSYDYNSSVSNFECAKSLKSLCLFNNGFHHQYLIPKMTSLTKLQLFETVIKDSALFQISKSCSKLQFLELSADGDSDATDEGIGSLSVLPNLEVLRLCCFSNITGDSFKHFGSLKKFSVSNCKRLDGKSLCHVLLSCKKLEELSIDAKFEVSYDEPEDTEDPAVGFFKTAERFLKLRHFINNKPLKVFLWTGFVIVTSNTLTDSEKVNLFFELYNYQSWNDEDDYESEKIFDTNDLPQLLNKLNSDYFLIKNAC